MESIICPFSCEIRFEMYHGVDSRDHLGRYLGLGSSDVALAE